MILHGCTVEDDCLIAMGSVLLNGVRIGAGSVVAAGAVVPEGMQVPPGSLVMGVPGRIVRPVDAALARRVAATWSHYVEQARAHRSGRYPLVGGRLGGRQSACSSRCLTSAVRNDCQYSHSSQRLSTLSTIANPGYIL